MYTKEHQQVMQTVVKFVEAEINPYIDEWEAAEEFPSHELFKKLGDLGLLGVRYPEKFGGMGLDFSYSMAIAEAFGACNAGGVPMAIGVHTDMCTPALARFGSDELRQAYLAPAIAGDVVACLGVSEPNAGSDVANISTHAKEDGDDYLINGSKMWITSGMKADWCCLLANTSDGNPYQNKSMFIVPLDQKGVERQKIRKMGMHCSDTAQLFFDNVRIPKRNLIGQKGSGFFYQMLQFQEERLWAAGNMLRFLDRIIDETIEYARERMIYGKPLLSKQVVYFKLGELRTEVEALRALTYRATTEMLTGVNVTRLASMAKLKAGRLGRQVADECLQFWGGMGYTADSFMARAFRDLRLISIGGGADEVMLGIIAKLEGTLPGKPKA